MSKKKKEPTVHKSLKIPKSLNAKLERMAKSEDRSFHGFVLLQLRKIVA